MAINIAQEKRSATLLTMRRRCPIFRSNIKREAALSVKDIYTVKLYRINESLHKPAEETFSAYQVSIQSDGSLQIDGESGSRSLPASLWGGVEVDRIPMAKRKNSDRS
jgi:hypothetical protein